MRYIRALSLPPAVRCWLTNARHPRILHVFDHVCNLINEHREVLSIVTPQIGNGPFNLVVEEQIWFSDHLSLNSPVSNCTNQLNLGDLIIILADATPWPPRPNWEVLHAKRDMVFDELTKLQITKYQVRGFDTSRYASTSTSASLSVRSARRGYLTTARLQSPISNSLISAIANADTSSCVKAAQQLAGLGGGLTPAGDDFLLGAIYAAWILHPPQTANVLAQEIANAAAPLTTSLSAAYLKAGSRGEAGAVWHDFFNALIVGDASLIEFCVTQILCIGHTSGGDALAGFIRCILAGKTHLSTL